MRRDTAAASMLRLKVLHAAAMATSPVDVYSGRSVKLSSACLCCSAPQRSQALPPRPSSRSPCPATTLLL